MAIAKTCPACGFPSDAIRCPRCNALKVAGCDGRCAACALASGNACAPGAASDAGADAGVPTTGCAPVGDSDSDANGGTRQG